MLSELVGSSKSRRVAGGAESGRRLKPTFVTATAAPKHRQHDVIVMGAGISGALVAEADIGAMIMRKDQK